MIHQNMRAYWKDSKGSTWKLPVNECNFCNGETLKKYNLRHLEKYELINDSPYVEDKLSGTNRFSISMKKKYLGMLGVVDL